MNVKGRDRMVRYLVARNEVVDSEHYERKGKH